MDNLAQLDVKIKSASDEDISIDKPLSFGSYLDLPISKEEREYQTFNILQKVDDILENQDRKDMIELVKLWRSQYKGLLEDTSFPFAGAYNLDMRLTAKIQDAVVAQSQEAFDDADPHWAVGPDPNKAAMEIRDKQEKILDYYDDTEMRNNEDLEAIRHDAFLLGTGFEALLFKREFNRVSDYKIYNELSSFISDFPNDFERYPKVVEGLQRGEPQKLLIEFNQEWRRSPRRTHTEFEDAIIPVNAKGVEGVNKAEIKGVRKWMRWHEIKKLEDEGDFLPGTAERLKYQPELDDKGMLQPEPEYKRKEYETYEMQYSMDIEINGETHRVNTLWNIERNRRLCMRAIRYPYNHNRCYVIPHCIKYTNKGLYQDGMGSMLSDIHFAANATLNQVLNASILANSLTLKVREGDTARRIYEHQFYPGSALVLNRMDDVEQLLFSTPNLSSLINLFTLIERFASDVSGIVNYQLGVESPEDPEAPASKTLALMRKAEIKLRRYIKNLKRSEDEAGYQSLRLIYQFIPVDRLSGILGEDVSPTKDFLQPAVKVRTNASGFAIEKMFEKRDDMQFGSAVLQDPLVAGDPERRSKVWHTIAKSQGSNWDKKIIGIVPTPEEIRRAKEQAQAAKKQKRAQVGSDAAKKAMDAGANPEEAREAANEAMKKFDALSQRAEAAAAPEPERRGGARR